MGIFEDITGGIQNGINSIITAGESALSQITTQTAVVGAAALGTGALVGSAVTAAVASSSKKKSSKKKSSKKRGSKSRDRKFISKQKHEIKRRRKRPGKIYGKKGKYYSRSPLRKAGKTSNSRRKGVHYTRKGQPYIILRSGKARFIKKRSKR